MKEDDHEHHWEVVAVTFRRSMMGAYYQGPNYNKPLYVISACRCGVIRYRFARWEGKDK